jgi:hypothetical protein
MPFILAKAWLASALIKISNFCLPYMAKGCGADQPEWRQRLDD